MVQKLVKYFVALIALAYTTSQHSIFHFLIGSISDEEFTQNNFIRANNQTFGNCSSLCGLNETVYNDCVQFSLSQDSILPFNITLWILLILVVIEAIMEKTCSFMPLRKAIKDYDLD